MGNDQNTKNDPLAKLSSPSFLKHFSKNYSFVKETRDPSLGTHQIYKKNNNSTEMILVKSIPTKLPSRIIHLLPINHPNFFKIMHISESSDEPLCGESQKMTFFSEFYDYSLASELERRSRAQEFFAENEIWYLLHSLISCGEHLQKNHAFHGSLSPECIYLSSEGHVKLINVVFMHNELDHYHNIFVDSEANGLLSPLQVSELKAKSINPKHNKIKSDVWAIGMIVLQAASLYNVRNLYDYSKQSLDYQKLIQLIHGLASLSYSIILRNLISELLQENEVDRPDFQELQNFLSKPIEDIPNPNSFKQNPSPTVAPRQTPFQSPTTNCMNPAYESNYQKPQKIDSIISLNVPSHKTNYQSPSNPQFTSQNSLVPSIVYQIPGIPTQNSENLIYQSPNMNLRYSQENQSPEIKVFKPIFVTPRKINCEDNSPSVQYRNETPEKRGTLLENLERFKQNYGEVEQGMDDLNAKIEKALDRSSSNFKKYSEIIH